MIRCRHCSGVNNEHERVTILFRDGIHEPVYGNTFVRTVIDEGDGTVAFNFRARLLDFVAYRFPGGLIAEIRAQHGSRVGIRQPRRIHGTRIIGRVHRNDWGAPLRCQRCSDHIRVAGKTKIIEALALHLAQIGPQKLYELSTIQILSGTVYLGEWQSKATAIFDAVAKGKSLLYFSDIWNLPSAGRSSNREDTVWDALRPRLVNCELQVIGEVSDQQLLALNAVAGFTTPFDIIEVPALSADQVASLVQAEAERISLEMDAPTAARLLELCSQFLPASSGPGPALRLTEQIRHYLDEKRAVGEDEPVTAAFVEKVFAVYSGLPRFVVSRHDVRPVAEIRDWFRSRIVGQRDAIDTVVQMITLFKGGLHDARRPIGSFLFVGPTGVGKTELARTLAIYLFGSEKRLLRFDLSEFKDYHSFQMLIGDPGRPERPARLIDPVRAQPFQVVLLDEIEKAHANVWDLLLQLLDDGHLTPARGSAVNFRNTIVIATANVGAQAMAKRPASRAGHLVRTAVVCTLSSKQCSDQSCSTASNTSSDSCHSRKKKCRKSPRPNSSGYSNEKASLDVAWR
jgi:ATP-dependent Clp protease ATP-binding subunit ClpA